MLNINRRKLALRMLILTLLATFALTAQALTPVTVYENVAPGTTVSCTGSIATLYEDPANPTPNLTAITLIKATGTSFYNTNSFTATAYLTAMQWSSMCATVNTPTRNTRVTITYDNDVVGNKKTLTGPPTFTLL